MLAIGLWIYVGVFSSLLTVKAIAIIARTVIFYDKGDFIMSDEIIEQENAQAADDDDLIVLEDEDGNTIEFQFLEMVTVDNKPYAVLMPLEDDEDDGGVVIVEIVDFGKDSEHYDAVTDEALLDRVFAQFQKEFADQYDFG